MRKKDFTIIWNILSLKILVKIKGIFWKLTRYFIKSNTASASIPPLHSTDENGDIKMYTTDKEKAECLNDYFISISRVYDENIQLPEF